ncbi:uncharacterized protein [Elaeis guineensis]|uniref:uncharacterized protein n=1 Tax=Elaeis guineensis var. tenera TaxID=51953 RepID=UPI003C6D9785
MIGDCNAIQFLNERKRNGISTSISEEFNLFMDHHQLIELKLNQRSFTWSNHRDSPTLTKLDRCLVTIDWIERFPLAMLMRLPKTTSDHLPLKLEFYKHPPCRKLFRFELFWLLKHDLKELIGAWWKAAPSSPDASTNLVMKLGFLRSKLKTWNRLTNGNILVRKTQIKKQISELDSQEEIRCLSMEAQCKRRVLREQLESILQEEEALWKQRAHVNWLQ